MDDLLAPLLWAAILATGTMGGVYFTFSAFVMAALAAVPEPEGMRAMRSINRVILGSAFMPLFFGGTLLAVVVAGLAAWRPGDPGSVATMAGSVVYVLGMFGCTVAVNVPLNRGLERTDPDGDAAAAVWGRYCRVWTRWNHVRTVASLLACGLYVTALAARGG